MDVRKDLYGGLVLTGGTAGFAALRDRLEKEVAELAPQMAKVKVRCGSRLVEQCAGSVAFMRGGEVKDREEGLALRPILIVGFFATLVPNFITYTSDVIIRLMIVCAVVTSVPQVLRI